MASRFAAVTNKEISQITKQAVPEISEGDEFCLEVLTGNLCLFDLNLSMKPVKNVFVYKCKLSSSLALLYVAELFINKLKTKFNSFFFSRMVLNTKRINNSFCRNFPGRAKQMPSKIVLSARKSGGLRFGHCAPKL